MCTHAHMHMDSAVMLGSPVKVATVACAACNYTTSRMGIEHSSVYRILNQYTAPIRSQSTASECHHTPQAEPEADAIISPHIQLSSMLQL